MLGPPAHKKRTLLPALLLLSGLSATTFIACEEAQRVIDYLDSISDGAPCKSDSECLGGVCLSSSAGYPGGYCTTVQCQESGCSGFFSECFNYEVDGKATTACLEQCNLDGSCDRASEGYSCVTLNDSPVCLPPGVTSAPVQGAVGSSCSANPQCNAGPSGKEGSCLQSFFGGYCAILGCMGSADCPEGNPCVALNPDGTTDQEKTFACMASCQEDADCRFGYTCQDYLGAKICLEQGQAQSQPRNPDGADDGAPCVSNINCKGGTCIREAEGADGQASYPGGYCTTRDCESDEACNGASSCISLGRSTACRATCTQDSDCRSGYACREDEDGGRYCDSKIEAAITPKEQPAAQAGIEIKCGSSKKLDFSVPAGAIGFYIAPYSKQNVKLETTSLVKPDGSTLNIPRDYKFLAINSQILGNMGPLLFPASDQSQFKNAFGPGNYSLNVSTTASEVCSYVLPKMSPGTKLDVNIYFVGVPGVTANSAKNDRDVATLVQTMKSIYSSMGITVNISNYFDTDSTVTKKYGVIRDLYDVFNLVATSKSPGDDLNARLSVNVFLIEDFNVSDAPGLLGLSTGIPGMAGVHGTSGSGLVFSTASLGKDNKMLGQTMAHEIGHFLGLRHTTEHFGAEHDPITDTPTCVLPDLGFRCNDAENFMFPFALGGDRQTKTTAGQAFVVSRNPLVK